MPCSPFHKSCQSSPWGQNWPHPGDQSNMYYGKKSYLLKPYVFSMWQRLMLPHLNPAYQAPLMETGKAPGDQ